MAEDNSQLGAIRSWRGKTPKSCSGRLASLQTLLQHLHLPMGVVDPDGVLVLINQAGARQMDGEPEDFCGRHLSELPAVAWEAISRRAAEVLATGQGCRYESFHNLKGDPGWYSLTLVPLSDDEGNPFAVQFVSVDITDKKQDRDALCQSETRYRQLVEGSRVAYVILQNGGVVYANQAAAGLLGYGQQELMDLGQPQVKALVHPEDWGWILKRTRDRLAGRPLSPDAEVRLVHKNGSTIWVEGYSRLLERDGDKAVELQLYDITRRKETEAALMNSLAEKEVLLKEIHHRVKNNMQVVQSLLSLQANQASHPELVKAFQQSQSRIEAMALIHETLYRANSLSAINLCSYLQRLCEELKSLFSRSRPEIRLELYCQAVSLDLELATPLGMAMNELLTNSLKHGYPEGGRGRIEIAVEKQDGDTVLLSVSDDGVGLPEGFDPKNSGALGLMLVTGLVEDQLGGRLVLGPQAKGACFRIFCPTASARKAPPRMEGPTQPV